MLIFLTESVRKIKPKLAAVENRLMLKNKLDVENSFIWAFVQFFVYTIKNQYYAAL